MAKQNLCPDCGAEMPSGALAGMCPKCLLAAGLESRGDQDQPAGGSSAAPTTPHSGSFVPPMPAELAARFPQLEIIELVGHGGMGAVYKARQRNLDRLVALKIIRPESASSPAFAERFNREARTLARLNHPHIVAVYDFGEVHVSDDATESQSGTLYFFLMEFVEGVNLRQLMQAGELTPQQALAIVPQICDALQFAHDEGVVHRDIKPENLLLDKRGRVKIADFGLAKLVAGSKEDFTLTGTHQVMGTPRYMAPEQMEGSHAVDHRADIFSLGVVFYEMLTGEVPIGHFEPPSKKVEIDVRLDEVVLRTLAREPERRYQQASDVRSDVDSITTTTGAKPSASAARIAWPYWTPSWQLYAAYSTIFAIMLYALFAAAYGTSFLLSGTAILATCAAIATNSLLAYWIARRPFDNQKSWTNRHNLVTLVLGLLMLTLSSMVLSPVDLKDWLPANVVGFTDSEERWLRIFSLGLFLWTVYFVNAHFLFALGRSIRGGGRPDNVPTDARFTGREQERRYQRASDVKTDVESISYRQHSTPIPPPGRDATADDAQLQAIRRRVLLPATLLSVIGVVSLVALAYGMLTFLTQHGGERFSSTSSEVVRGTLLAFVVLCAIPLTTIIGGVKMLRLTSYGWAVAAGVTALIPNPAAWMFWLLGLPVGLWSLFLLSKAEVKQGFALFKQRVAAREQDKRSDAILSMGSIAGRPFPWTSFWIGLSVLLSLLGLIVFAMVWTGSAWPLVGLALPCFVLGFLYGVVEEGDEEAKSVLPAIYASAAVTLAASAALMGYGVMLTNSAWPLWSIALFLVAIFLGIGAGATAAESEKSKTAGAGEAERDGQAAARSQVEVSAYSMILIGVIATGWLLVNGPEELRKFLAETEVVKAAVEPARLTLLWCLFGPVVALGGYAMLNLRWYWLAVLGSATCVASAAFQYAGGSGELFAVAYIGAYALWKLFRPEVQQAFQSRFMAGAHSGVLPPAAPATAEPVPERLRGTLGQAWDEWWAERDRWVTLVVQNVLGLIFAFSLVAYLGGHSKSVLLPKPHEEGQFVRHIVAENGLTFSPWFSFEMNPPGELGWHWEIHWISWSSAIMLFGFAAWWANWQIEKAKARATGKKLRWWHGSPNFGIAIWAVGTVVALLFSFVLPALTP